VVAVTASDEVVVVPEEHQIASMGYVVVEVVPEDGEAFSLAVRAEGLVFALLVLVGIPAFRAIEPADVLIRSTVWYTVLSAAP
jgi:hypothetical protein